MTSQERHNWLKQNPVTAARQFDHRLQAFMKQVVMSKAAPIGKVTCFFQRTEFQLRGSPHAHIALWVDDAPKLATAKDDELVKWIDQYVTCELPAEDDSLFDEVNEKQRHVHSVACRKGNLECRFHYPKPPSDRTLMADLGENSANPHILTTDEIQVTLRKVLDVLDNIPQNNMSLQEILLEAHVSEEIYYRCLSWSKSKTCVLKRKPMEMNINNYNKDLLRLWKANMDLQFVCDPYACIAYIVAYVTKDEKQMSQSLKAAAREVQNADVKTKLKHIGSAFLSNREVSAQEAAYRVLGIPLKRFNCKLVWIPTDLPEDRISILKSQSQLDLLEDDDTDVYASSIIDKYAARPFFKPLNELCLAQFASWYQLSSKPHVDLNLDQADPDLVEPEEYNDAEVSHSSDDLPMIITLLDGKGIMKKLSRQAVPRYHVLSEIKQPEKYFHQQLLLFYPWRNEIADLLGDHELYEERYEEVSASLEANKFALEHHSEIVSQALHDYEQYGPPLHAWDMLDSTGQHARAEEQAMVDDDVQTDADDSKQQNKDRIHVAPSQVATTIKPYALEDKQLRELIRMLNNKQRQVFQHIIHWCFQVKMGLHPQPFHIFVSGGAGTGKSQLIRAIYHQATKMLQKPGDDPDHPTVLLTAPTGCAAYNIGGATLHGALNLPLGKYYSLRSNPSLFATFQNRMAQLKIIVIDEVSMVGRRLFADIHQRLQEAKGVEDTKTIFGGVSILAVGDLFQLPPVHQYKLFDTKPTADTMETGVILSGLWHDWFRLVELDEVMRQRDDKTFANMLNRIRTSTHKQVDLELLNFLVVSKTNPVYPSDALHIFARRKAADDHNNKMLNSMDNDEKIVIKSVTKVPPTVSSFDENAPIAGLVSTLELAKTARVMLIRNMDVADGLVNGATGIILDIIYTTSKTRMPKSVIVKFDDPRVGTLTRQSSSIRPDCYDRGIPILPIEVKQNVGRSETSPKVTRIQIPLVLCWATTIHKVQGATLDTVVISCKHVNTKGMMYVALSRVTSISGLHLLDFQEKSITTCKHTKQEIQRLSKNMPLSILVEPLLAPPNEGLRICWFNVQSAWDGHQKDMSSDPFLRSSHVIALSETWQNCSRNSTINLPYFPHCQYWPRVQGERGGVAVLSKMEYPISNIKLHPAPYPRMEATAVHIHGSTTKMPLQLVLLYRTEHVSESNLLSWLADVLLSLDNSLPTVFGGDFNIDIKLSPNHKLFQVFENHNFSQQISEPTHNKGSLLDHVWVNKHVHHCKTLLVGTYYSDHCQLYTDILF